jgi:hypothetical protein
MKRVKRHGPGEFCRVDHQVGRFRLQNFARG